MRQRDFPRFMRLPPEVRCRIWSFALLQPRVHRLRIGPGSTKGFLKLYPTETLPRSTVTRRRLLETCVESRLETMRSFPDVLPLAYDWVLRFNKEDEVICLAQLDENVVEWAVSVLENPQHPRGEPINVDNVQKLAIELRHTSFICYRADFVDELNLLARFSATFRGLQWLFLVPRPLVADPETVFRPPSLPSWREDSEEYEWESETERVMEMLDDVFDTDESDDEEPSLIDGVTQAEGNSKPLEVGEWLRGENGLGDWYRWVPDYRPWLPTSVEVTHFIETASKAKVLEGKLRNLGEELGLTEDEKAKLAATRVEVMMHLREGVEPVYEV